MTSVLVLEDRPTDRELLATMLRFAGYAVEEASTAREALDLIHARPPDVIAADILMPEMNGSEFVRRLREDPGIAEIPVIFSASSYDEEEVRSIADDCGVSHLLLTPALPDQVVQVVSAALGSNGNGGPPASVAADAFDREQLQVLNQKLVQKAIELDVANRLHDELQEHLRAAQREAAETLTLLETIQSTAPAGLGFVDREFRIIRMNETLASVTGLPLAEQLGRRVPEVAPEQWPQLEPIYRQVLDSGKAVVNREIEGPGAGGSTDAQFWLASYYPVQIESEVIGVGVVVLDITELKQAEDFRSVVTENMAEGLYAVDNEGCLSFMNRAASKMLGWKEEELRGKPVHEAIHFQHADGSSYPPEECQACRRAQAEGRTVLTNEDAFTCKDGSILPVSSSAAPLMSGTGIGGAVVVFRDTTEETAERLDRKRELDALTWVGRVREALDEGRLVLYSQPIVPLGDGEGREELLLRMVDRKGDTIPPNTFLPVAEKYGLIGEIDKWVVPEAIRLAGGGRRVHANLSADSISNLDLLSLIERELEKGDVDPADVIFELTETALMEDLEAGETFARGLVEIGCGLALDDFGTGFGSFTYLKKFPIGCLKIDIEFVRDLVSNPANQHLVKATVGLAHDFGYETVAEGVEDAETLGLLKDYGVDFAQGFHLGRPAQRQTA
jgi:PAS domain S-box-containing protein